MNITRKCAICHNPINLEQDYGSYIYDGKFFTHSDCFIESKRHLKRSPWSDDRIAGYLSGTYDKTLEVRNEILSQKNGTTPKKRKRRTPQVKDAEQKRIQEIDKEEKAQQRLNREIQKAKEAEERRILRAKKAAEKAKESQKVAERKARKASEKAKQELEKKDKQQLIEWLLATYHVLIPRLFYKKLDSVYDGTYKGLPQAIPPDYLLDMWQQKINYLNQVAEKNRQKGRVVDESHRLNYDLAILLSKYDGYLEWRRKKEMESQIECNPSSKNAHRIDYDKLYDSNGYRSPTRKELYSTGIVDIESMLDEI